RLSIPWVSMTLVHGTTPEDSSESVRLPGKMVMRESCDLAIDALLADVFLHATNCVRSFGDFHLAISASPEIEPALMRLMYDPGYREFPWQRTRVWMVDELDVAPDDPRRRWTRIADTILACSGIPQDQCVGMDDSLDVGAYEQTIRGHLEWRERGHDRIDCCLFATSSLSHIEAIAPADAAVRHVRLDPQFVRAARLLGVLVTQTDEQSLARLSKWARGSKSALAPTGGELVWYVGMAEGGDIPLA
ncbi:MAG: 6-phosphogluconolactonase, partial [Planctomycetota bacterium]|nr:6-phosphogluconolactonase [Planctomycetota bacterium]